MKSKHLLLMLLLALMAPWAAQAQQCEISYNLTDSYGDGWNGGSMVVTDATTSTQLASLTISNGSSLVGTIPVTSGHEITFSYTAGSYAYENSWVFTDIAGTTIWEGSGDGGSQSYTYTAECPTCFPPSDITVTLTPGQGTIATFSWSSDATAWQICFNNDESNLFDVNRPSFTYNGFTPETQYTVKVRTNCDGQYSSWSSPVTFTPTNAYQITVNDGTTTNEYVPIYGYYVDSNTKSQFIIPANVLGNMAYGTITQLTFYASQSSINWGNATFEVYMSETAGTTVSTLVDWSTMTKVRNAASLSIVNNMMVVVFDTPYEYQGGNLMIGFNQPTTGSYVRSNWYGVSATGASIGGYGSSVSQKNFLPKTTFNYVPGEAPACPKPMSLTASDVTAHGATVAWTSDASAWQIQLGEETAIDVTEPTYTFTGLAPETPYSVKVRANCDGAYSDWTAPVSFTTGIACPVPTQILVSDITAYTAVVSWVSEAERFSLQLGENVFENVTSPYTLTDLTPNTSYTVKVKAICGGEDGESQWSNGTSFMTAEICPEGMVCIGTGTATSNYMPLNNFYKYSLTEQIYTAAEIGEAGAILSIDFYKAATIETVKNLDIYIVSTNKTEFASNTDWIQVTASDLVYSGTVTFADNAWTTIELDSPFIYDGVSNICIVVDNNTGSYVSNTAFRIFSASNNQTLYYQSDSNNLDPTTAISQSASGKTAQKNRIRLNIGEPPACPKPMGVTASDVTAHEATISWTSDASAWQIQLGEETAIDVDEATYTFNRLEPETTYAVKVRANCGGVYSDWANGSFTTAIACTVPTGVAVSNITGHGATITWAEVEGAWYQCAIAKTADYDVNNIEWSESFEENTLTLNGLDPQTGYTFALRKDCTASEDGYSQIVTKTFTTTVACPAPTVAVSNITAYTAEVNCTNTEATDFNVQLINPNVTPADTTTFANVEMPYTLTDLTANTSYKVRVQAICGGEDGESAYSNGTNFMTAEICPEGMVCIGTGTATSSYVPAHNYYNYSLTEQIYTAAEIGTAGQISSIEFYKASTTAMTQDWVIYMVNTTKDEFTSTSDWIPVTASDIVYQGSVTFVDNDWTNIELQTPFDYDGTSNLCVVVDNNTGDYVSSTNFRVFSAEKNQALYQYNDNTNLDPTAASIGTGNGKTATKNRIRIAIGEPPACPKPTGVAVNYEGGITATVTWEGDATSYNIDVNGIVTEGVTSPYTLEGLELATTYAVMVQANCGEDQSEWTSAVSFTTDMCLPEDMCEISYSFTDAYNDSWNGAYISVVDVATEAVLYELTMPDVTGPYEGSFAVCDGRTIQFVWHSGSYDSECSYVVTDINDEEIFSGSGAMSAPVNYTVNCTVAACPKPTDLAVNYINGLTATVTWEGDATSYNIDVNGTVTESVTSPYTLEGLGLATTYVVMVQANCGEEQSEWSNAVGFTTDFCLPENQCELTFVLTDSYGDGWNGAYIEVLDVAAGITLAQMSNQNLSKGEPETETYTLAVCDGRELQFVWHSGSFDSEASYVVTDVNGEEIFSGSGAMSEPVNYTVNCTLITCFKPTDLAVEGIPGKTSVVLSWTPGTEDQNAWRLAYMSENDTTYSYKNVTSNPYTLNGLTPETSYTVKVRANCGGGDYSNWSEEISFTTAEACPAVIDHFLASNITVHNAQLNWTGEYESYQVHYKKLTGETEWSEAIPTNEAAIALSGLEANTDYMYQVRGYCSDVDVYSEWVDGSYFTTQSICEAPQNLYAVPGIDNATISWTGYQESYTVAWGETFETVYGTTYTITGLTSSTDYTVTVTGMSTECGEYQSATLDFTTGAGWDDPTIWVDPENPETINPNTVVVIEPGENPTEIPENITVGDGSYIVIEPGAEVIYGGEDPIPVVLGFDDDDDDGDGMGPRCRDELPGGYRLIASPVFNSATEPFVSVESTHLMDGDDYYANDLYSFDQNFPQAEWRNYKEQANNFVNFNWKQGYLYYGDYTKVQWSGNMVANTNNSVEIALDYYEANTYLAGLNLIGNPFWAKGYPNMNFYVLNPDGNEVVAATNNYVGKAKGFFVLATEPGQNCTVSTNAPVTLQSLNIALSQDCSLIDAAAIRFNDTKGLAKIQLNPNHTKIYMPFEGKDYAILQGEGLGEMPLNFEAEENGTYTLSFTSKEVNFSYLHLIDNLTGVETNLLANPSYSFEAKTTDYASRFRLVYATGSSVNDDNFGFINSMGNLSIYGIEGVATLQVMDVTGRILSTETFSGSYERKLNVAPGVYMLRLINGNDVKVQKMVIR